MRGGGLFRCGEPPGNLDPCGKPSKSWSPSLGIGVTTYLGTFPSPTSPGRRITVGQGGRTSFHAATVEAKCRTVKRRIIPILQRCEQIFFLLLLFPSRFCVLFSPTCHRSLRALDSPVHPYTSITLPRELAQWRAVCDNPLTRRLSRNTFPSMCL